MNVLLYNFVCVRKSPSSIKIFVAFRGKILRRVLVGNLFCFSLGRLLLADVIIQINSSYNKSMNKYLRNIKFYNSCVFELTNFVKYARNHR